MSEVWIRFNGKARGPYSLESLGQMHRSGQITDSHEVWLSDSAEWKSLGEINGQIRHISLKRSATRMPESNSLDAKNDDDSISPAHQKQAGLWRRFFARIFDVWFFMLVVCIPLIFAWAYYAPSSYLSFMPENELVAGICILFFVFIIDAIAYAIFGNTPGKALLGLRVKKANGGKYLFGEYAIRNLSVWWTGFALGIPLLNFVTMFLQFRKVKKTGFASYDADKKGEVVVVGASAFKTVFFVLGAIILLFTNSIVMNI